MDGQLEGHVSAGPGAGAGVAVVDSQSYQSRVEDSDHKRKSLQRRKNMLVISAQTFSIKSSVSSILCSLV